jgi:hypothetical protein
VAVARKVVDPAYLEAFCRTASYIASRFRSEGLEAVRMPASARFAAKPTTAVVSAPLAQVDLSASPPSDAAVAARPFRAIIMRDATTWARPLLYGAVALVAAYAWAADDVAGRAGPAVIGVIVGVVVFALTARFEIASRSQQLGKEAFLREYGRAHDLVMEEPRSFHARQASANLPGAAEHVLTGQLRALGLPASLVLCCDQARGSKDVEYEALVLPSGAERTATLRVPPGAPPPPTLGADASELLRRSDGVGPLGIGREGGTLVIYAERRRKSPVSAAELDLFVRRAAPVVERLRAPAA